MATATKSQLRKLLGDDRPTTPPANDGTNFVVRTNYYGATAPANDLHEALDLAWEGYRMSEQLAEVWDYRDGEPHLVAVVGVLWNEEA